ncbi:hypothetical protein [Desmospora profundinema]|uniref:Uncharacterized protein n=1 Tax=Desmospora profundinema TaxID=1571184 RepID=A0ABU1IMH2_9BACL|nr:hypothetical protein [Desmospora profundinema]MDR6225354.1 hypothetical protein [Desmospora profundinema]
MTISREAWNLLFHDWTAHRKKWVLTWGFTIIHTLIFVIFYEHLAASPEKDMLSPIMLDLFLLAFAVPWITIPFMDRPYQNPLRIGKLTKTRIAFLRTLPISHRGMARYSLLRTWTAAITNGGLLYGGMVMLSPTLREAISPVGFLTLSLLWLTGSFLWGCWIQRLEWGEGDETAFIGVLIAYYCTLLFTVSPIYYLSGKSVFQWTLLWSETWPWLGLAALLASFLITGLSTKAWEQRLSKREW